MSQPDVKKFSLDRVTPQTAKPTSDQFNSSQAHVQSSRVNSHVNSVSSPHEHMKSPKHAGGTSREHHQSPQSHRTPEHVSAVVATDHTQSSHGSRELLSHISALPPRHGVTASDIATNSSLASELPPDHASVSPRTGEVPSSDHRVLSHDHMPSHDVVNSVVKGKKSSQSHVKASHDHVSHDLDRATVERKKSSQMPVKVSRDHVASHDLDRGTMERKKSSQMPVKVSHDHVASHDLDSRTVERKKSSQMPVKVSHDHVVSDDLDRTVERKNSLQMPAQVSHDFVATHDHDSRTVERKKSSQVPVKASHDRVSSRDLSTGVKRKTSSQVPVTTSHDHVSLHDVDTAFLERKKSSKVDVNPSDQTPHRDQVVRDGKCLSLAEHVRTSVSQSNSQLSSMKVPEHLTDLSRDCSQSLEGPDELALDIMGSPRGHTSSTHGSASRVASDIDSGVSASQVRTLSNRPSSSHVRTPLHSVSSSHDRIPLHPVSSSHDRPLSRRPSSSHGRTSRHNHSQLASSRNSSNVSMKTGIPAPPSPPPSSKSASDYARSSLDRASATCAVANTQSERSVCSQDRVKSSSSDRVRSSKDASSSRAVSDRGRSSQDHAALVQDNRKAQQSLQPAPPPQAHDPTFIIGYSQSSDDEDELEYVMLDRTRSPMTASHIERHNPAAADTNVRVTDISGDHAHNPEASASGLGHEQRGSFRDLAKSARHHVKAAFDYVKPSTPKQSANKLADEHAKSGDKSLQKQAMVRYDQDNLGNHANNPGPSKDSGGHRKDNSGHSKSGSGHSKDNPGQSKDNAANSKPNSGQSKDASEYEKFEKASSGQKDTSKQKEKSGSGREQDSGEAKQQRGERAPSEQSQAKSTTSDNSKPRGQIRTMLNKIKPSPHKQDTKDTQDTYGDFEEALSELSGAARSSQPPPSDSSRGGERRQRRQRTGADSDGTSHSADESKLNVINATLVALQKQQSEMRNALEALKVLPQTSCARLLYVPS